MNVFIARCHKNQQSSGNSSKMIKVLSCESKLFHAQFIVTLHTACLHGGGGCLTPWPATPGPTRLAHHAWPTTPGSPRRNTRHGQAHILAPGSSSVTPHITFPSPQRGHHHNLSKFCPTRSRPSPGLGGKTSGQTDRLSRGQTGNNRLTNIDICSQTDTDVDTNT